MVVIRSSNREPGQDRNKYEITYHNYGMEFSEPSSQAEGEYGRDFKAELIERQRIVHHQPGMGGSNVYPHEVEGRLSVVEAQQGIPAQAYVRLHGRGEGAFVAEPIEDAPHFRTIIDDPSMAEPYIESHLRELFENSKSLTSI